MSALRLFHNCFLSGRVRLSSQFGVTGLLFLLPLGVLFFYFQNEINQGIQVAELERAGVAYSRPVTLLLLDVLRHQQAVTDAGLRDVDRQEGVAAAGNRVNADITAVNRIDRLYGVTLRTSSDWRRVTAEWQELKCQESSLTLPDIRDAHLDLARHLTDLLTKIGNNSNLILDPKIDSYYTMDSVVTQVPQIMINVHQARETALGTSRDGSLSPVQRAQLTMLIDQYQTALRTTSCDTKQVTAYTPAVAPRLDPLIQSLQSETAGFSALLCGGLFRGPAGLLVHATVIRSSDHVFGAAQRYDRSALDTLDWLLQKRLDTFLRRRTAVDLVASLSAFLALCFFLRLSRTTLRYIGQVLETQKELRRSEGRYRMLFEDNPHPMWVYDPKTLAILAVNEAAIQHYGYSRDEFLAMTIADLRPAEDQALLRRSITERLHQRFVHGQSWTHRTKDGRTIAVEVTSNATEFAGEQARVVMVQDVTERRRLEAERERLLAEALDRADRDPLTGLWNHRAFQKRFEEEADRALREGKAVAVAVLDLNNFKFFNEAYGHPSGDEVLRRVAEALRRCCRSYDILARFGGDEFAILMPVDVTTGVKTLHARLTAGLAELSFQPPGYDSLVPLSVSLGMAVFPEDAPTRQEVILRADERLFRAKSGAEEEGFGEQLRQQLLSSVSGFSMLDALVTAVDNKDRYTRRHSEDVLAYSLQIAEQLDLDEQTRRIVATAAILHDVGKIGVPDHILRKPGRLTDEEMEAVKHHPLMGAVIVGAVPGMEAALDAIRHHHERWDGEGYPFGLAGEETPLIARLMAVADAFSAMTTDRPYRKGMSHEKALSLLDQGAGAQWDAVCVQAFRRARRVSNGRGGKALTSGQL